MSNSVDKREEIEIPRGSGIEGFMVTIRKILELPRVQVIHIENGRVAYVRSVRAGEPERPLNVDFESLLPSHVIRRAQIEELPEEESASVAICKMLQAAGTQHLHPIALASGMKTLFWDWHLRTTGVDVSVRKDQVYGIPFLRDELLPNETLVLCAGFTRGASLVDTRFAFKMSMPLEVEVKKT